MSGPNASIWDLIKDGDDLVHIDDLDARLRVVLEAHPELVAQPGVNTTLLYSGSINRVSATEMAGDIAARSNGTIGIVDNTPMGRELGKLFDAQANGTLDAQFSRYLDFSGYDLTNPSHGNMIGGQIYEAFRPTSAAYASQMEGRVLTLATNASNDGVFARNEVPELLRRVESGAITHVNGRSAESILEVLSVHNGEARYYRAFELMQSDAAEFLRANDIGTRAADGTTRAQLVIDDDQLRSWGAGDDVRLRPNGYLPDAARARSGADAAEDIARVMDNGDVEAFSRDPDGRVRSFFSQSEQSIVTMVHGQEPVIERFDTHRGAQEALGARMLDAAEAFPDFHGGGMPTVINGGVRQLATHLDDVRVLTIGEAIGQGARATGGFLGRASKVLGPLGLAATGYEVWELENKASDYDELGLLPDNAYEEYVALLAMHTGQATLDPSLFGGEVLVQEGFDFWADQHNIPESIRNELEPGSTLEDVGNAASWVGGKVSDGFYWTMDRIGDAYSWVRSWVADDEVEASQTFTLEEAGQMLQSDLAAVSNEFNAIMRGGAELTESQASLADIINSDEIPELFEKLRDFDVETLSTPEGMPMDTPVERVRAILMGGAQAYGAEWNRRNAGNPEYRLPDVDPYASDEDISAGL